jgi:hypothetical protein
MAACGGAAVPAAAPTKQALARTDVFTHYTATAEKGAAVVRPTSFIGTQTINTDVLAQLIKQRVSQVQADALRDLIKGILVDSEPLKDARDVIAGLVVDTSDGETKSQTLVAAVVRDGLSFLLSTLAEKGLLQADKCQGSDIPNAVYEGLAQSQFLHPLGFPQATGAVPSQCVTFAQHISLLADGVTKLPALSSIDALDTALSAATLRARTTAGSPIPNFRSLARPQARRRGRPSMQSDDSRQPSPISPTAPKVSWHAIKRFRPCLAHTKQRSVD